MKCKLTLFFGLLAGSIFLAGCREEKSYELSLKIPIGYIVEVKDLTEAVSKITRENKKNYTSQNNSANLYKLECISIDADGVMTIKKTWLSAQSKINMFDEEQWQTVIEFDSEDPNNEQKGFCLKPVIGKSVLIRISANGYIQGTEGTEELAAKVAERETVPEELKKELVESFSKSFGYMPGVLGHYPRHKVKVGDSWKMPWSKYGSNDECITLTWKFKKVENGIAFIIIKAVDLQIPFAEKPGFVVESDIKQNSEIELQLDIKTGLVKSCKGQTESAGTIIQRPEDSSDSNSSGVAESKMNMEISFKIETTPVD